MELAAWLQDPVTVFHILDKGGDGSISYDEWMSEFERLDFDGDGVLQRRDWAAQMGETDVFDTLPHDSHVAITREEWRGAFQSLDTNRDRRISPDEWRALHDASLCSAPTPPVKLSDRGGRAGAGPKYLRLHPTERLLGRALDHLCDYFCLDKEEVYLSVRDALPHDVWEALYKGMVAQTLKMEETRMWEAASGNRSKSQPPARGRESSCLPLRKPLPMDADDADSDRIHYVFGDGPGKEQMPPLHEWRRRSSDRGPPPDSESEGGWVAPPPFRGGMASPSLESGRLGGPSSAARRGRRGSISLSPDDMLSFQANLNSSNTPASPSHGLSGSGRFPHAGDTLKSTTGVLSPFGSRDPFASFPGTGHSLESSHWSPGSPRGLTGSPNKNGLMGTWTSVQDFTQPLPHEVGGGGGVRLNPQELADWLRKLPSARIEDSTKRVIARTVVEQGVDSSMFLRRLAERRWAALGVEDQWQATKILELWKMRRPQNGNAVTLNSWMKDRMANALH